MGVPRVLVRHNSLFCENNEEHVDEESYPANAE